MKVKVWCARCRGSGIINKNGRDYHCDYCKSKGYIEKDLYELDPDDSLPEIPGFEYDKPEDIPLLQRGAINYSKMLGNWRKVKDAKE